MDQEFECSMPEEDIAAIYRDYAQDVLRDQQECFRHNSRLFRVLRNTNGDAWMQGLDEILSEGGIFGKLMITRREPRKEQWQRENYGPIREIWVDQHGYGDTGDSHYGTIWVRIDDKRFLELSFCT